MPTPETQNLLDYLQPRLPTYIAELSQLCGIESPSDNKSGVDEAGAWVARWARQRGWDVETWPDEVAGDSLVATLHGKGSLRVILAAHLDTVYPLGTVAQHPVEVVSDKLIGPGTADNKGGLLSSLYVMDALQHLNLQDRFAAISLVCGGDEETNMRSSEAFLRYLAPAYDLALVLEPGRPGGEIVSARKGIANFLLASEGKAAHAGVEPQRGAHAILAAAHQIIALQALNGARNGLTVNVGVVGGGTRPNVVPDKAWVEVDARVLAAEDMEFVSQEIENIAGQETVPGVTTNLVGGWHFGPMLCTPAVAALVQLAQTCGEDLGFAVCAIATGGGSYANPLSSLGLALLDGLGPVGGNLHSPDEYIDMPSIVPRIALVALLMLRSAAQVI